MLESERERERKRKELEKATRITERKGKKREWERRIEEVLKS